MVPVANYIYTHPDDKNAETYKGYFDVFREICLEALVHDSTDDQYGLIGGHPYDGYSASVGTNSVLIGSVAAMRSGISGWDFRNGEEWIQEDSTSIIGLLYKKYFENADGEFKDTTGDCFRRFVP